VNESLLKRLVDLEDAALQLKRLIQGKADLPGMLVARCAVAVDKAVSALEKHHGALAGTIKK